MSSGLAKSALVGTLLVITACTASTDPTEPAVDEATVEAPAETNLTAPTIATAAPDEAMTPEPFEGSVLPTEIGSHFSGSGACATCHSSMIDASGADISIDSTWRSSMMANAARDPYWLASVQAEVVQTPDLANIIEDKCSTCHMPISRTTDSFVGTPGTIFGDGYLNPANERHVLAMDGVSCTVCHQIEPANLGTEESFSGGFLIDADAPKGNRVTFGPFEASEIAVQVMQGASGFAPVQSDHIQESTVCATCHTLYTPFVDADGVVAGVFPEQTPFLELQASNVEESCQDCHMPEAEGEVAVSTVVADPRSDVSRHYFVGGNKYMMSIMNSFGSELGLTSSSDQIRATSELVSEQLTSNTAAIEIDAQLEGTQLRAAVTISNATGHKFPTGFPSRRTWIHFRILDANGTAVFESGAWTPDGAIVGNDNDTDPSIFEPHYSSISDASQVQIYETILLTTDGNVTTTLLRGAAYGKDNRLLPIGFDKSTVGVDIAAHGTAVQDENFVGGTDTLDYLVDVGGQGEFLTVEVKLLYQPISYRWIENLVGLDGDEIARFASYSGEVPNIPITVAAATITVGG